MGIGICQQVFTCIFVQIVLNVQIIMKEQIMLNTHTALKAQIIQNVMPAIKAS